MVLSPRDRRQVISQAAFFFAVAFRPLAALAVALLAGLVLVVFLGIGCPSCCITVRLVMQHT